MNRKKRCKHCKEYAIAKHGRQFPTGWFCCLEHAIYYAQDKAAGERAKEIRRRQAERRKEVRTKGEWAAEAQKQFNIYIRLRDADLPCISCQRHHKGQYHAGHYRSRGAAPQLRFSEDNVHKQCAPCNNHRSGNISEYRINLVKKIGVEKVDEIESCQDVVKYSVDDFKAIIAEYKLKIKKIKKR